MKLAIMQPYLFPYLGYFQLAAAVDRFVFYDDVNFIKNGWINRNRLLLSGEVRYFTVPLRGASSFVKINEVCIESPERWRRKMLESVRQSYVRAPHFAAISQLMSDVLAGGTDRIAELARNSVLAVAEFLGLRTDFIASSSQYGNAQLNGAERVLDICAREAACEYHNVPGGRELYTDEEFAARGIRLHFVAPELPPYPQTVAGFHPGLSIIDVLMCNGREGTRRMLGLDIAS